MIAFPPSTGPVEVALARSVEAIPEPNALRGSCAYELKIDGWRLIVLWPPTGEVELWSRNGASLTQQFPELVAAAQRHLQPGCCVDGEVTVWRDGRIDWTQLQTRMASAARAAERARVAPTSFLAFDLLAVDGADLRDRSWAERRSRLEEFAAAGTWAAPFELVPYTTDRAEAQRWFTDYAPFGIEGLVIKGRATPYRPGRREWLKCKHRATSEAVIGAVTGSLARPESLILGRCTSAGELMIIGRSVSLHDDQAAELAGVLRPSDQHPWPATLSGGFFGGTTIELTHVEPTQIVEIAADAALLGGRHRHAVRYLRRRPDLTVEDLDLFEPTASP
jgi:ATP-dependent DNA ligase